MISQCFKGGIRFHRLPQLPSRARECHNKRYNGIFLIAGVARQKQAQTITLQSKPGDVLIATHKELGERTNTGLTQATARAAEGAATAVEPLPVTSTSHLRDIASAAAQLFGRDQSGGTVNANQALVGTQEQLEQIRQLRES